MTDILTDYATYFMPIFGTPQLAVKSACGSIVTDAENREYIDLLGGIAVNTLGHSNPELVEEISKQAATVMHTSNFFTTEPQVKLAQKLANFAGGENARVFFTNSGTEALEGALKIVKKHGTAIVANSVHERARIIALTQSFHGRSLGALSITYKTKYREPFNPLIPNIEFIKAGDLDALEDAFSDLAYEHRGPVAGMFMECIQGEAGVKLLSAQYIARARHLTNERGALLIIDEVQTGIGRTGTMFAHQNPDIVGSAIVRPDIITLAKGLGGGFPIGAVIAQDARLGAGAGAHANADSSAAGARVSTSSAPEILQPGDHGTTFGGNPLACATALKVLEIIERDNLLQHVKDMCEFAAQLIRSFKNPHIAEISGAGLLLAFRLDGDYSANVAAKALENGLIVNAVNPNSIRIAPALNIDSVTLEKGLTILNESILAVAQASENIPERTAK